MYALNLAADYRILSATDPEYATESMPIVEELPDGDICDYYYRNGEYIYEEAPWKAEARKQGEIAELKNNLSKTDWISCKIADGKATVADYATEIEQRQAWRDRIDELEAEDGNEEEVEA